MSTGFVEALVKSGKWSTERAEAEYVEAWEAIRAAVPKAAPSDIRRYLESEYGGRTAQEVASGRSVALQLETRLKRFLTHFAEVQRRGG